MIQLNENNYLISDFKHNIQILNKKDFDQTRNKDEQKIFNVIIMF